MGRGRSAAAFWDYPSLLPIHFRRFLLMDRPEKKKPVRRNALLDTLRERFAVFRDGVPLAIGIHKAIRELMPEVDNAALRTALRLHTTSTGYLKSLAQGSQRFDLGGSAAGEATAEQREQAATELRERFRKAAEKRQADEEARRHQEKLEELARKFGRR